MCVVPEVLNYHVHGRPDGSVYIGRGSKWGNPFVVGRDGDRDRVIERYKNWLRDQHHLLKELHELRDKQLVCFCKPLPCHGDILFDLASMSREELISWWKMGSKV